MSGERCIVVTISVQCMCVHCVCMHPSAFVRVITCTFVHGFQSNLAQMLSSRSRKAIKTFVQIG